LALDLLFPPSQAADWPEDLGMRKMRAYLLLAFLVVQCFTAMAQTNEPPKKSPAEVMRDLRLKMLTTPPAEFGHRQTPESPRVYGVLMDWPLEAATVSVVSFSSGDASIYTTGTFGVLAMTEFEQLPAAMAGGLTWRRGSAGA
jgi:hypothetical protein